MTLTKSILCAWFLLGGLLISRGANNAPEPLRLEKVAAAVGAKTIRLTFVIFEPESYALRVIDNAIGDEPRFHTLQEAMEATDCVAGCNGSFFDRKPFNPVGLMISAGETKAKSDPRSWLNGVVAVRNGQLTLEDSSTLIVDKAITEAIQAGPMLVKNARVESGLDPQRMAPRTFICHDRTGHWALGAAGNCTLNELALALVSAEVTAIIEVKGALNFDGGPSTGLWAKIDDRVFYRAERWPVRNYIGLTQKAVIPQP